MCYCTFWREHCPGKAFPADLKMKNTLPSRRRRLKPPWLSYAKVTLTSSKSSWNTAGPSSSSRSPTTSSALACSKTAYLVITTMPKCLITPGSRTDYRKIKRTSRPKCSEFLVKRNLLKRWRKSKRLLMARPMEDMPVLPWVTQLSRLVNREDPS